MIKKRLLLSILFMIIAVAAWRIWDVQRKRNARITDTITREDIKKTVEVSGNILTAAEAPVTTTTTGIISELFVQNGTTIQTGQKLFSVKSISTEQEKAAAYAAYMAAKASLGTVQANQYSYQSTMFEKWKDFKDVAESSQFENDDGTPKSHERTLPEFHTAEKDWLAAEALYKTQSQSITQAQAAVTSTYLAYQATQDAIVTAPMPGTVINLSYALGDKVTASSALTTSPPILTVANLSSYIAKVSFTEADIIYVSVGQPVRIYVDVFPEDVFDGHMIRLDTKGTKADGSVIYYGYVLLDTPPSKIKPMMSVVAKLESVQKSNVLTVPHTALIKKEGTTWIRTIDQRNREIDIPVRVGVRGLTRSEISGPVKEQQVIVIPTP